MRESQICFFWGEFVLVREGSRGLCLEALMCNQCTVGRPSPLASLPPPLCPPILTPRGKGFRAERIKSWGTGKKCFSGSDVWESNERPSSNPVAKQPKCYAEGISLKLESKHRSELVNQAQAGGCTPTLQRGQVGGFAKLKEERRERQRENAADL